MSHHPPEIILIVLLAAEEIYIIIIINFEKVVMLNLLETDTILFGIL